MSFRFSLRRLAIAFTLVAVLIAPVISLVREGRRRSQERPIVSMLRHVSLAVVDYSESRGMRPSDYRDVKGNPLNSWRFQVWPYMESIKGFPRDMKAAWNAPANSQCVAIKNKMFGLSDDGTTNVYAITGPGTAVGDLPENREGPLPNDVLLATEVADSKTHWMQPGDYDVTALLTASGKLGDHVKSIMPHRVHVVFADHEVWTLSDDTPMEAVKPFLTIAGAEGADRNELLTPHRLD